MGVNASLVRFPGQVFEVVTSAGTFHPPNGRQIEQCHLDRSWDELHPLLATFGHPLSLALSGDYGYQGGLQRFGWGDSETDHYLGYVSPPLVKDIAVRLSELTSEQLRAKLTDASRGSAYMDAQFNRLAAFYATAASEGNCIFIYVA